MHNRSAFLKSVWTHYRRVAGPLRAFDRKLFAEVLRFMWKSERVRLQADRERRAHAAQPIVIMGNSHNAPVAPLSEMEARIDALKWMSARYPIGRMEQQIRAEYAHA